MDKIAKFKNSKYIFVVGIGGSNLASKAVWNALTLHKIDGNKSASPSGKKIFFLEAPDKREYEEIESFVFNNIHSAEEAVLIAISKSGSTAETLETYHKTFDILSEKFGHPILERVLIISSPNTPLWKLAEMKNIERLSWEGDIGGRFSAFTAPHLSVLEIAGVNTQNFLAGKSDAREEDSQKLAEKIFENYKKGAVMLDFFFFNSELEDLGKWCRQLIAESLSTLSPAVALGPVDLHSMLELYLGGPKTRFTIFVRSKKEIEKSVNEMAYKNVTEAYQRNGLPFEKYEMEEINERDIGRFMELMMQTTVKLGALLGVNPYGQPAVEEYKKSIIHS